MLPLYANPLSPPLLETFPGPRWRIAVWETSGSYGNDITSTYIQPEQRPNLRLMSAKYTLSNQFDSLVINSLPLIPAGYHLVDPIARRYTRL